MATPPDSEVDAVDIEGVEGEEREWIERDGEGKGDILSGDAI